MNKTLIAIAKLLKGSAVYENGDIDAEVVKVLHLLSEQGEVTEIRRGQHRWWAIEHNTLIFVRERVADQRG